MNKPGYFWSLFNPRTKTDSQCARLEVTALTKLKPAGLAKPQPLNPFPNPNPNPNSKP